MGTSESMLSVFCGGVPSLWGSVCTGKAVCPPRLPPGQAECWSWGGGGGLPEIQCVDKAIRAVMGGLDATADQTHISPYCAEFMARFEGPISSNHFWYTNF